jgi:hypothetical protein
MVLPFLLFGGITSVKTRMRQHDSKTETKKNDCRNWQAPLGERVRRRQ